MIEIRSDLLSVVGFRSCNGDCDEKVSIFDLLFQKEISCKCWHIIKISRLK